MKCIADVNVLLPLLCGGHVAEKAAYRWFDEQPSASVGWCLPIRLAILRHLGNRHIMGDPPLEPERTLAVWAQLEADDRLFEVATFPSRLEHFLQANVAGRTPSPKHWTDAWLAALAESLGYQMVSFDKDFARFGITSCLVLTP